MSCFCHIRVECYFEINSICVYCHICHCKAIYFLLIKLWYSWPPQAEKYCQRAIIQSCFYYISRDVKICIVIFVNALIIFSLTYLVLFYRVMDLGLTRTYVWFAALLSYNELTEISFVLHVFWQVIYFEWYLHVISKPVRYVCRWVWSSLTLHLRPD